MPNIDAIITPSARLSQSMTDANRPKFNFALQNYLMGRKPDFWVYLFNIGEQSHDVYRPPLLANLHIPACPHGKPYIQAARFPQPLLTPQGSVDSDEITIIPADTCRFAQDICNPDNLSLDQNAAISTITAIGNNLNKKGVFWSLNEVPTEQEINDAKTRMEAHYNALIEKARAVETSDPTKLNEILSPELHHAADYFGIETSWHGKRSRPMDCPNCGERIKAGVAFHKTEEGTLCILDWTRAVRSGVRTRQQAIDAGFESSLPALGGSGAPISVAPVAQQAPVKPLSEEEI